ncbi:precorrin-6y C5,15-methyltransferase (decarboxylating) subunit CbiE [Uliginosibacterium gangwonense]|uniref:precorrin-6y C5,15-methyltransferase (decarboxylating) subunit CbiE n=1 Tax=Uliginosibacterium gangwonense TaxID=392736 RepID=UPI00037FE481|nr:precorrin-6y C5,15-methyltransferase (decarboxylating) subunit CbiE [Uliginosibacterium gangwonense]
MTQSPTDTLIGILDNGWAGLTEPARQRIFGAQLIIGAGRTLELIRPHIPTHIECRDMDGHVREVADWVLQARMSGQNAVILATGDPLCHGIGSLLGNRLENLEILPNLSCLQLAFAHFARPSQIYRIASCHGPDSGEWANDNSNTPAHSLYDLMQAISRNPHVAAFTSPENTPARIARALLAAGYDSSDIRISVAARLHLPDEALFENLSLQEAAQTEFPQPNVVLIEHLSVPRQAIFGFADADYIQRQPEKGLITKQEVRAVSLARLGIHEDSIIWDIGAGSGSVGLEAARLACQGHVYAIEKNVDDAANARVNARRLRATNYTLIEGKAPAGLEQWPAPDAVFIGGSGGELAQLIALILDRLKPGGHLVMNFVTLENLAVATQTLATHRANWDVVQLQASRSQPILDMHRMAAQNPVWIVSAQKP